MADTPLFAGGCYCGALRYTASGKPVFKAQCHCRPCQYFSGGGPNYFMLMPVAGFSWAKGTPQRFAHPDLENPVTRSFCATCGTHILTELPHGDNLVLKVGTLDEPASYKRPAAAIHSAEKQPFHQFPEGAPVFEKLPPR